MKARLPKGFGGGGAGNLQQLAMKAQKMQKEMDALTSELDEKEYVATSASGGIKVTITGKPEVKNIEIDPQIVDKDDVEMLSDLIIVTLNEAIRAASAERSEKMDALSAGLNVTGLF